MNEVHTGKHMVAVSRGWGESIASKTTAVEEMQLVAGMERENRSSDYTGGEIKVANSGFGNTWSFEGEAWC